MITDIASLQSAVHAALVASDIPGDATHAFAIVATANGSVKAVISTKVGQRWQVDLFADLTSHKKVDAGVQIKYVWNDKA